MDMQETSEILELKIDRLILRDIDPTKVDLYRVSKDLGAIIGSKGSYWGLERCIIWLFITRCTSGLGHANDIIFT